MFRAFVFGVVVAIVIALVGGYFVLRNGIIPANADATPGWLETWAADTSLGATLRREAPGTNPVPLTDENLITAIKRYGQHCAICHGTAKGDPSASPVAKGLYPRPPQLASDGVEDDPEGFSFWKIKHGIGGPVCRHGRGRSPTNRSGPLLCSSGISTSFRPPQSRRGKMS
jgi:thiosulfate dehydrogenase